MARRFDEIEAQLANPAGASINSVTPTLVKERAQLEPSVQRLSRTRRRARADRCQRTAGAERRRRTARTGAEENRELSQRAEALEAELTALMVPRDPDDAKDVFVEVRAGTGGDEAAIFAGDLARMYMRFAESNGMRTELVSENAERSRRL